jgi:hypothetical protein
MCRTFRGCCAPAANGPARRTAPVTSEERAAVHQWVPSQAVWGCWLYGAWGNRAGSMPGPSSQASEILAVVGRGGSEQDRLRRPADDSAVGADTPSYVEWRMDALDMCGSVLLVRPEPISAGGS